MAEWSDSQLSPQEIADRERALEVDGFPPPAVERFARDLAGTCQGPDAEGALGRMVGVLPVQVVRDLVAAEVMGGVDRPSLVDCSGTGRAHVAQKLVESGIDVDSAGNWSVTLREDGDDVGILVPPLANEDHGVRFCRLALVGIWILRMRRRPPQPPQY